MKGFFKGLGILAAIGTSVLAESGQHGYAVYKKMKYPKDFTNFDYVNPQAPKGGRVRIASIGTFDNLNPFILKGVGSTAMLMCHGTLLASSGDEPGVAYGYVADEITIPKDHSSVTFHLNPKAKFNNGEPVTVEDVIFSFEILTKHGHPVYRTYYKNVKEVKEIGKGQIQFTFINNHNREMPLILGGLPIFSKKYYSKNKFEETSLKAPVGCGPYEVKEVDPGRRVTLHRVKDWWGEKISTQIGQNNFDEVVYDYYRDSNAMFIAFESGQVDFRVENTAKTWATGYTFKAVKEGKVILKETSHEKMEPIYGFFFNTRRSIFKDLKVRKAITDAFNFTTVNRMLFFNAYNRNKSIFPNSKFAQSGLPQGKELELLNLYKEKLAPEIFTHPFDLPSPETQNLFRESLTKAQQLLKEAGWVVKDQTLVDPKTKKPFSFEILIYDKSIERIALNLVNNLKQVGINVSIRSVDTTTYQERVEKLDYDMILVALPAGDMPGNEQRVFWHSSTADSVGSRNLAGVKNPVIDELVEKMIAADTEDELIASAHAFDRVVMWDYLMIPGWHLGKSRFAYWDIFGMPSKAPLLNPDPIFTWWIEAEKVKKIEDWQGKKRA